MKDIRQRLLATFQAEHREHVERIRALLGELSKRGGPPAGPELDEVFRRAHSLKGAARAVDLGSVEMLAHRLETLFSRMREGRVALDRPLLEIVQRVLDTSEDLVAAMGDRRDGRAAPDPAAALAAIEHALGVEGTGEGRPRAPAPAQAGSPARPAPSAPAEPSAPATPAPARAAPPTPDPVAFQAPETVRLDAQDLDRLLRSSGQLLTENLRQELVSQRLSEIGRTVAGMREEWDRLRRTSGAPLRQLTESPELKWVTSYIDSIAADLRVLSGQTRAARLLQQRSAWSLRRVGAELQRDLRAARMVPAEDVFGGFRRMMRELARSEQKEIDFQVEGLSVEADRVVLQALKDPLMHLLRNAINHGIEAPEERRRRGKNPIGRVTLRLEARDGRLSATVEDDGAGIDLQRVAEVAVEKGLIPSAERASRSPRELGQMIFQPGFSTARSVTRLSGRGMGLSVVHEAAARLQGDVEARPREDGGVAIVLSVPLSIATHRLLLVRCQGQTFALPTYGVDQLTLVRVEAIQRVEGRPIVRARGQPVPLASLAHALGIGGSDVQAGGESVTVIVLKAGGKRLAVAVDEVATVIDGVIEELAPEIGQVPRVEGGVLLGDGSVALVLSPLELIESVSSSAGAQIVRVTRVDTEEALPVLVVDDSITTRTLEKSILEAHGYRTGTAVDGMEALSLLRSRPFRLVIADVQMPRMDGFGLLEAMKGDPRLAAIPVILVTSLDSREDRERGLNLGADAYIIKKRFDQRDLLDTIEQIL